jgi:hypothetical protein
MKTEKLARIMAISLVLLIFSSAQAKVCVYYFWQYGCSACASMETYLDSFEQTYSDLEIHRFELHDFSSWQTLYEIDGLYGKDFSKDQMYTPTTFIGDKMIVGANPDELEGYIIDMQDEGCACPGDDICELGNSTTDGNSTQGNIIPAIIPTSPFIILSGVVTVIAGIIIGLYLFVLKK